MLAGMGIVAGLGALCWVFSQKIFAKKARRWLVLITMFSASVSPWLIQFSRAGWEVNLATFFILWGVISGWQAINEQATTRQRFVFLTISILLLFAAMYTYHSARILAPALGLFLAWQFVKKDLDIKHQHLRLAGYIVPLFLTAFLLRPFAQNLGTPALRQRLAETSIFNDLTVIEKSNYLRALHDNSLISKVIYHRYVLFAKEISQGFLDHLRLDFLFISGDQNPRHSTGYFGLFYFFELIFLLVGSGWAISKLPKQQRQLLLTWLFFGLLPVALTKTTPHALRAIPTAPVSILLLSFGVWQTWVWLKRLNTGWWPKIRLVVPWSLLVVYLFCTTSFFRHLLYVYPQQHSAEWQFGYQPMIEAVENLRFRYPDLPVYVTREQGRPAMYYWFYTKTDPTLVQAVNSTVKKDQGEFLEFDNLHFVRSLAEVETLPAIVAGSPAQLALFQEKQVISEIANLDEQVIWVVAVIQD
jgi:hypothetical protein